MRKLVMAMAFVGLAASPALAFECPLLQKQIDAQLGNRLDAGSASGKAMAAEAWALHKAGKHAEAVAKYDAAAKAAGMMLKHKKK